MARDAGQRFQPKYMKYWDFLPSVDGLRGDIERPGEVGLGAEVLDGLLKGQIGFFCHGSNH